MTRPLYLPLHRITLSDEVEKAEAEMMRNTHTRPARIDEPETIITDFGGLAEPRPNIVKRAFDAIAPDVADEKPMSQERRLAMEQDRETIKILLIYTAMAICAWLACWSVYQVARNLWLMFGVARALS